MSHGPVKLSVLFLAAIAASAPLRAAEPPPPAVEGESLTDRTLRDIAAREAALFAKADKEGDQFDRALFHGEAQSIASSYDVLIEKSPDNPTAIAAYGLFLSRIGMDKSAIAMLLKANKLDPNIATVKNQVAKLLAEDGKPVEALPWLMAAIDLAPNVPLYHQNLGQLLQTGRDTFISSGEFTRAGLDRAMLGAYQKAAELEPRDLSAAYAAAKAYYDIDPPQWEQALQAWTALEERPVTTTMRQLVRLQRANVLIKLGRRDEARAVIDKIDDPKLDDEKKTLLDQLGAKPEK